MSDVKRKTKKVEVEVVELKIELGADFFDNMEKAKKQVADKRGYDISYGEYIQEAMEDLVQMVEEYSNKIYEASEIIKKQDAMLNGNIEEDVVKIEQVIEEPDKEEPEEDKDAPAHLYAHIEEDSAKEIMYV